MPQPFTLPLQIPLSTSGALLAGAKLYFYQTGTSTPQDTYSSYTLAGGTENTNPVVADSNGVFPVIWLGRTTRYRVLLTTSADVPFANYPIDDVGPDTATLLGAPSIASSNTLTGSWQKIQNAEPRLIIDETDAGTDKRLWDLEAQAGVLSLRTRTDADGSGVTVWKATRSSGTAVSALNIPLPLTGLSVPVIDYLTADGTSSSTTLANSSLSIAIDASTYAYFAYELYAPIYGGAGGISFNMNYSGTYTGSGVSNTMGRAVYNGVGTTLMALALQSNATTSMYSTATLAGTNPQDYLHLIGTLKALSNGNLSFSFGLNSASGTVTVRQGSWLKVTPMGV